VSAYSDLIVAETGLASYWRLGESSGTTATAAFGATNGTYSGTGVTYGQPGLLPSDPSATSVLFDDTVPGSCSFGDVYDFSNTANYTVEVWVKPDGLEADSYIWTKGGEATGGWLLQNADPVLVTRRVDSGGVDDGAFITSGLSADVHHVVFTYDGTTLLLYVDGVQVDDVGSTRNLPNSTDQLRLGVASGGGSGFDGWFQDAAIYTAALDAATVLAHYTAGITVGQTLRPDADIVTTGWTATPLWSKIEETSADGTVVTGTAS
jgi:hypothetical protein